METLIIKTQEQAESLVVDGVLRTSGHLKFECAIKAGWFIEACGYIKSGESIEADWYIKAGEYIEAGGYIKSGWSIEAGRYIKAGESIEADWYIKAGESIEAGRYIKAGESIEAGRSIEAGGDFAIYCGMNYRLSQKHLATISAKKIVGVVLLGTVNLIE